MTPVFFSTRKKKTCPTKMPTRSGTGDPPISTVNPKCTQGRELAFGLGLKGDQIKQFTNLLGGLARMFIEKDLGLVEIVPHVLNDGAQGISGQPEQLRDSDQHRRQAWCRCLRHHAIDGRDLWPPKLASIIPNRDGKRLTPIHPDSIQD